MTSTVEIVPFTWGRKRRQKALQLEEIMLSREIFRFRPTTLVEVAAEFGLRMNPQRAGWFVRKYWQDWEQVPVHNGTLYVHESKYLGYEAEVALAKQTGTFQPRSHVHMREYRALCKARAELTRH